MTFASSRYENDGDLRVHDALLGDLPGLPVVRSRDLHPADLGGATFGASPSLRPPPGGRCSRPRPLLSPLRAGRPGTSPPTGEHTLFTLLRRTRPRMRASLSGKSRTRPPIRASLSGKGALALECGYPLPNGLVPASRRGGLSRPPS